MRRPRHTEETVREMLNRDTGCLSALAGMLSAGLSAQNIECVVSPPWCSALGSFVAYHLSNLGQNRTFIVMTHGSQTTPTLSEYGRDLLQGKRTLLITDIETDHTATRPFVKMIRAHGEFHSVRALLHRPKDASLPEYPFCALATD